MTAEEYKYTDDPLCIVSSVWCVRRALDVLPLKPSRNEGRGRVRGSQPVRHKPASAKPASAPKAPRESRSPKRRRPAASAEEAEQAEGADEAQAEGAEGGKEAEGSDSKKGRGRGKGRGNARGRRKATTKREDAAEDDGIAEQVEADGQEDGQSGRKGGKSRGTAGSKRSRGGGKSKGQETKDEKGALSLEEDDGDKKQAAGGKPASLEQQRKRKGDLEYENQVAMAMQVRAWLICLPHKLSSNNALVPNSIDSIDVQASKLQEDCISATMQGSSAVVSTVAGACRRRLQLLQQQGRRLQL